jgi:hypothetical protein
VSAEVQSIALKNVGGELTLLVDYGTGPGILCDDGKIRWCGEAWLKEPRRPRKHVGRYTQQVNPYPQERSSAYERR